MKYVYKVTYPNGKIYVGKDSTGRFLTYFGSSDNIAKIEAEHTMEQKRNFTIRKEILWESADASESELSQKETELIVKHEANNPAKGYNLRPTYGA